MGLDQRLDSSCDMGGGDGLGSRNEPENEGGQEIRGHVAYMD